MGNQRSKPPTYTLSPHSNNHPSVDLWAARARFLREREPRRQECFAAAVAHWDPGAA